MIQAGQFVPEDREAVLALMRASEATGELLHFRLSVSRDGERFSLQVMDREYKFVSLSGTAKAVGAAGGG